MKQIEKTKNIGKEIGQKLASVGIYNLDELKVIGSKEAFCRLKKKYDNICLVHLYALEGAIKDVEFNELSEEVKKDLKQFSDSNKK